MDRMLEMIHGMCNGRVALVMGEPGSGKTRIVKTIVRETGCVPLFDPYNDFKGCKVNPEVEVYEEVGVGIDLSSTKRDDLDKKYELFTKLTQQRHRKVTFFIISQTMEIYNRFNDLDKVMIRCKRVPRPLWLNFIGSKVIVSGFGQRRVFFIKSQSLLGSN